MRAIWIILAILAQQASACEILVKAVSHTVADQTEDRVGAYKAGMIVCVMPDGHPWGLEERLPKFVVVKVPLISEEKLLRYVVPAVDASTNIVRRREWIIRVADLPLAARTKLLTTGGLTIKATAAYTGAFDFTWDQVKTYFRNLRTGIDEGRDL